MSMSTEGSGNGTVSNEAPTTTSTVPVPVASVKILSPEQYAAWNKARTPREIIEVPQDPEELAREAAAEAAQQAEDEADRKRRKEGDKPATVNGIVFQAMKDLRKHVKVCVCVCVCNLI